MGWWDFSWFSFIYRYLLEYFKHLVMMTFWKVTIASLFIKIQCNQKHLLWAFETFNTKPGRVFVCLLVFMEGFRISNFIIHHSVFYILITALRRTSQCSIFVDNFYQSMKTISLYRENIQSVYQNFVYRIYYNDFSSIMVMRSLSRHCLLLDNLRHYLCC